MIVFSINVEMYNTRVEFVFASKSEHLIIAEELESRGIDVDFISRVINNNSECGYYSKEEIPNHGFLVGIISDNLGENNKKSTIVHYIYEVAKEILESKGVDLSNVMSLTSYITDKIAFDELW